MCCAFLNNNYYNNKKIIKPYFVSFLFLNLSVSESSDVSFVNQMMVDTRAHDNPSAVVTHRVNQTVQSVQSNDNNNDSNISLPNFERYMIVLWYKLIIMDHFNFSLYPKITSSKQRANYKSLFNNASQQFKITLIIQ